MSTGPDILEMAFEAGKTLAPSIEEAEAMDVNAIRSLHGEPILQRHARLLERYVARAEEHSRGC